MIEPLKPGDKVRTVDGGVITVKPFRTPDGREKEYIGDGGQGTVYLVDYLGKDMALKWYKQSALKNDPQRFYDNIRHNVDSGAPDPVFLWPEAITEWKDGTFGYVMGLVPAGYKQLSRFIKGAEHFSSYRAKVDAALQIVSGFRLLHNRGYSYLDMNDGNFFIDPKNGSVRICDNDNVAEEKMYVNIAGKPRYMAPEIVVGQSRPNTGTDLYSMALILFYLFCLNHPLEGKRYMKPGLTKEDMQTIYGSEPIFVMDPDDKRNCAHPAAHRTTILLWNMLPDYMRDIFLKAFSKKALHTPAARPREQDWLNVLTRFRSEIVPCECGNEIFTQNGETCACEVCGRMVPVSHSLELHGYRIPAVKGSRIYRCQLGVCNAADALKPVAQVVRDMKSGKLYLQNLTENYWNVEDSRGGRHKIRSRETMPLLGGTRISVDGATVAVWRNNPV